MSRCFPEFPAKCSRDVHNSPTDTLSTVWPEAALELARLLRAMGTPTAKVDDLLQDVYLSAWQKQPAGLAPGDLRRWLFRVALNRCNLEHRVQGRWRRLWRRRADQAEPGGNHSASRSAALDAACRQEDKQLVRRALGRIKPQVRTILVLRYFAEFDSKEIAQILEIPDSTVRSHLRAGRQQLASKLKRAGYEYD
jgi:RNA polymerase sigma-70 factor, ECF subfamily